MSAASASASRSAGPAASSAMSRSAASAASPPACRTSSSARRRAPSAATASTESPSPFLALTTPSPAHHGHASGISQYCTRGFTGSAKKYP
ncbi:hypothetical protein TSO221_15535 [Azospirillum sp. TSO22-1]|nr:hypothetical protein TSO221_15535 [Azospirillum sp. TSO22-1]